MEVKQALATYRAIRAFDADQLGREDLERIVEAGRRAGSSKNSQRRDFVVVEDRARLERLAAVGPWAGHIARAAVAIALVTPNPRATDAPLSVMWDLGLAAENMILRAWDLGIGSCPATVYDHALARSILGYPEDRHCEFILSFGRPADPDELTRPLRPGGRRSLAEVVHRETW